MDGLNFCSLDRGCPELAGDDVSVQTETSKRQQRGRRWKWDENRTVSNGTDPDRQEHMCRCLDGVNRDLSPGAYPLDPEPRVHVIQYGQLQTSNGFG
jgi:hypothetical protein